ISGSLRQIGIELEHAAAVCGASSARSLRDVMLPLARPGILAGWMLMFVSMMRELSASIFLFVPGTQTVAVSLVERWQEADFSSVAVLSLTLVAISLTVVIVVRHLFGQREGAAEHAALQPLPRGPSMSPNSWEGSA